MQAATKKGITYIGSFSLVMLMTGAVDGISNLPSIAIFGQQLVFFFLIGSLIFLIPTGLVSAELCKQFPDNSGIYVWSKAAFSGGFGALTIWLQWINTMVWFPTCLTTLVGTAAFLIDPKLIQHPAFLVTASLVAFWTMTILNLKGIKRSAKIASLASSIGMVTPMILIIGLSALWILLGKPMALHLNKSAVMPSLSHTSTWTSLTAVITAFLGMELAAVHVRKVKNAHQVFPKALIYAVMLIIVTMGLGALGVALVIPHHNIVLVSGTMQAFNTIFVGLHMPWLASVIGIMLVFGSLGTMVNWLISPANGLAQAAGDGYLPKKLAKENNHGVPDKVLIAQAVVVSIVLFAFFLMPSVNGSYWLLLDLSTELYVIMYLLMFIAAIRILLKANKINIIPGGKIGALIVCSLGLIGCMSVFVVGFFPPHGINVGSHLRYVILFAAGVLVMCSPALLLKLYHDKKHAVISKDGVLANS